MEEFDLSRVSKLEGEQLMMGIQMSKQSEWLLAQSEFLSAQRATIESQKTLIEMLGAEQDRMKERIRVLETQLPVRGPPSPMPEDVQEDVLDDFPRQRVVPRHAPLTQQEIDELLQDTDEEDL